MLALMYAGELCYWAWELMDGLENRRIGEKESREGSEKLDCTSQDNVQPLDTITVCNSLSGVKPLPIKPIANPPLFSGLISLSKGTDYVLQYCVDFSPATIGQRLLEKYVTLAQGPLKDQNWNYSRAVQLVRKLKETV